MEFSTVVIYRIHYFDGHGISIEVSAINNASINSYCTLMVVHIEFNFDCYNTKHSFIATIRVEVYSTYNDETCSSGPVPRKYP